MKLLLAILITIGLLATSDLLSTLVYFDLLWILVACTSIWVTLDSKRIDLKRYKLLISWRPLSLFSLCSLLWIFVFPWYLWARFKIKAGGVELKENKHEENRAFLRRFLQKTAVVAEYAMFFVALGIISLQAFCTFESWRAPRLWAAYKQQLETKGETLDWNDLIPPPVPDDQKFFEARMMSDWFVKPTRGVNVGDNFQFLTTYSNTTLQVQIASITIGLQPNASNRNIILNFDDFESHRKAMQLLQNTAGNTI